MQEVVKTTFDLDDDRQSLSYRLIDAYGLFDYLLGKNRANDSSAQSESSPNDSSEVSENG